MSRRKDVPLRPCLCCGKTMQRRAHPSQREPATMYARRKYCSRACACQAQRRPVAPRPCRGCGAMFTPNLRNHRVYCSDPCLARAHNRRRREATLCAHCPSRVTRGHATLCWYHLRHPPPGQGVRGARPAGARWGRPRLPDEQRPCARCGEAIARRLDTGRRLDARAWARRTVCPACQERPDGG